MLYQTRIIYDKLDEQEICDLVQHLAKFSVTEILIEKQLMISTDDINLSSMLDSLADAIRDRGPIVMPVHKKSKVKKSK